jgi:hypothetical protein
MIKSTVKKTVVFSTACIVAVLPLAGCNYIEKKIHHHRDNSTKNNSTQAPENVKGKSLYAAITKGYLDFHAKVSAFKPKRFKMDFLPDQKFETYDQDKPGQPHLYEKGMYQYKKTGNDTGLLVITIHNKQMHETGYGNFTLTFARPNQGMFTAKLYSPDSNDHYKQSGTFKLADY